MSIKSLVLAAHLVAGTVVPVFAQVSKPLPGGEVSGTERLPAPAKITATQEPAGPIRVVWSSVEGAVRYSLTRSVPPAPAALVNLPNPTDTVYIDRDVKPGSTYYYLVGAVNEGGIIGMKVSASPVKAEDPARYAVPAPPTNVRAVINGNALTLSWNSSGDVLRFRVERGTITENSPPAWISLASYPSCCFMGDRLEGVAPGTRVQYRIRAESQFGALSEPVLSNEITTPTLAANDSTAEPKDSTGQQPTDSTPTSSDTTSTRVRPAVIGPATRLKVGETVNLGKSSPFTGLKLTNPRWLSLNQSTATVTNKGVVKGVAVGVTHIVAIGTTSDGAIASLVQMVDVKRQ